MRRIMTRAALASAGLWLALAPLAGAANQTGPALLPAVSIPSVDHKPVTSARQKVAAAQTRLTQAQEGVNRRRSPPTPTPRRPKRA